MYLIGTWFCGTGLALCISAAEPNGHLSAGVVLGAIQFGLICMVAAAVVLSNRT